MAYGDEQNPKHSPLESDRNDNANRDPITGSPGAHPVGVGVGAVGGASAGAAIGSVAGPIGTVVGTAIGGIAGGLIGKGVAEGVSPTDEHAYWQDNYRQQPYYVAGQQYDAYGPAYQYGWESYARFEGKSFEDIEPELRRDWDRHRADRDLTWDQARPAASDAWRRVSEKRV